MPDAPETFRTFCRIQLLVFGLGRLKSSGRRSARSKKRGKSLPSPVQSLVAICIASPSDFLIAKIAGGKRLGILQETLSGFVGKIPALAVMRAHRLRAQSTVTSPQPSAYFHFSDMAYWFPCALRNSLPARNTRLGAQKAGGCWGEAKIIYSGLPSRSIFLYSACILTISKYMSY